MSIQNPLIYWAFLAVLVPIFIHLFGRNARKTAVIPSLMWLDELKTSKRRKRYLKDYLVLLLRVLTVFFVVLSLFNWRQSRTAQNLVVDHHPAGWDSEWFKAAVNQLDDGTYRLYLRDGSYLGEWDKTALSGLFSTIQPANSAWRAVPEADLLTYGFDSIPFDFQSVFMPERSELKNIQLDYRLDDQKFIWENTSGELGDWRIFRNGTLYAKQFSSFAELAIADLGVQDTFEIQFHGDSVLEDNTSILFQKPRFKTLAIVSEDAQAWSSNYLAVDSIVPFSKVSSELVLGYDICVLEGLDFIPQALGQFQGTLLHFYPSSVQKSSALTPQLQHPFYATYFFGPSLQNAWPQGVIGTPIADTLEPLLLDAERNPVGGIKVQGDLHYYQQSFFPLENEHPYYTALFQWAGALSAVETRVDEFLGQDQYSKNLNLPQVINYDDRADSDASRPLFWTREKIALALALLSALLALIFAKI